MAFHTKLVINYFLYFSISINNLRSYQVLQLQVYLKVAKIFFLITLNRYKIRCLIIIRKSFENFHESRALVWNIICIFVNILIFQIDYISLIHVDLFEKEISISDDYVIWITCNPNHTYFFSEILILFLINLDQNKMHVRLKDDRYEVLYVTHYSNE